MIDILRQAPKWIWLALFLAVLYALRYHSVFLERILLWDDFFLLGDSATLPRFRHSFFYTFLHFVPFLRLSMLGFMQLVPVHFLPMATSLWAAFWVGWLAIAFFRLARLYGISPVPALLGIAFIVFNPMFAEVQVWLTSTFYLVALVFVVEGLVQVETALATGKVRHWAAAAILSVLAPCAWSTGYIVAPLYFITVVWDRAWLKNRKAAIFVVTFSFLAYPILRVVGEYFAGHTYLQVEPWNIFSLLHALLKIIGDGLVLGSLGLWRTPDKHVTFSEPLLIFLSLTLIAVCLALYVKSCWRKQIALALTSIILGLAIPIFFRGSHFPYEDFRWFIRYFTTPLFGLALVIAVAAHMALQSYRRASVYVGICFTVIIAIALIDRMPEHYVGGGHYKNRFREQQVKQLRFFDKFFSAAKAAGVGAQPLIEAYFLPVEGNFSNVNGAALYGGHLESNNAPIKFESYQVLDQVIRSSGAWRDYQLLSYSPDISGWMLEPKDLSGKRTFQLSNILNLSGDIRQKAVFRGKTLPDEFLITGGDPYVVYSLPTGMQRIDRVLLDIEVIGLPNVHAQLALASKDPLIRNPSLFVSCPKLRCSFDVPISRLPWFPPVEFTSIRIDPDGVNGPEQKVQLRLWNISVVPET